MNINEWHERYVRYLMERADLTRAEAENCLEAGKRSYDYNEDPEDAVDKELSCWERLIMKRPPWEKYFMDIAFLVKRRSTCKRRQVGAVLVKDKRILTTGYNGAPSGSPHCLDIGCLREELKVPSGERDELCRGIHAEQNCIIQAARYGISVKGSILYCTTFPCSICAKMLVNIGVSMIVYRDSYDNPLTKKILQEGEIKLAQHIKGVKL